MKKLIIYTILSIEVILIVGIVILFYFNRFDRTIANMFYNTIVVGTFSFILGIILSLPGSKLEFPRQFISLSKLSIVLACVVITLLISLFLTFYINQDMDVESNEFSIYLTSMQFNDGTLILPHFINPLGFESLKYFNSEVAKSKKIGTAFYKQFLEYLIIRSFAKRYSFSWSVVDENEPFLGLTSTKQFGITTSSSVIKDEDIQGHEKNYILGNTGYSLFDDKIVLPNKTNIILEHKEDMSTIIIESRYCGSIRIELLFKGLEAGTQLQGKEIDTLLSQYKIDKKKLSVYRFRSRYVIAYNKLRIGTKDFVNNYRYWMHDLTSYFKKTFDSEEVFKRKDQQLPRNFYSETKPWKLLEVSGGKPNDPHNIYLFQAGGSFEKELLEMFGKKPDTKIRFLPKAEVLNIKD